MEEIRKRALGAYLGLAIGDALGATVEFMTPREIRHQYGVHKEITGGGWLKLDAGEVTDDTEMSLALGRAILQSAGWDGQAAAEAFVSWLKTKPADVGNTCRRGIRRFMADGTLSGPVSESDGGNGAAMRILPVVISTLHDDESLHEQIVAQCHLTHNHPLSDAASTALGSMARKLILGGGMKDCRKIVNGLVEKHPKFGFNPYPGRASGYIVDTMQTVLFHFFHTDSFESCLIETVNRGEDADTTGAIAGMLAGALYGLDAIPDRWLKRIDPGVSAEIRLQVEGLLGLGGQKAPAQPFG